MGESHQAINVDQIQKAFKNQEPLDATVGATVTVTATDCQESRIAIKNQN